MAKPKKLKPQVSVSVDERNAAREAAYLEEIRPLVGELLATFGILLLFVFTAIQLLSYFKRQGRQPDSGILVHAMGHEDVRVRRRAVVAGAQRLKYSPSVSLRDALLRRLDDDDLYVRRLTIREIKTFSGNTDLGYRSDAPRYKRLVAMEKWIKKLGDWRIPNTGHKKQDAKLREQFMKQLQGQQERQRWGPRLENLSSEERAK
jgi:hypothetical protein